MTIEHRYSNMRRVEPEPGQSGILSPDLRPCDRTLDPGREPPLGAHIVSRTIANTPAGGACAGSIAAIKWRAVCRLPGHIAQIDRAACSYPDGTSPYAMPVRFPSANSN